MMRRILMVACALILCSAAAYAQASPATDAMIQRLETAKWKPSTLSGGRNLHDLFADDFVTIEYGPDPTFAGVNRVSDAKKVMQGGGEDALVKALNQMSFDLSDWKFQHLSSNVILVSYKVASPQFGENHLWATSVWRRARGKWQTTFYQASKAR